MPANEASSYYDRDCANSPLNCIQARSPQCQKNPRGEATPLVLNLASGRPFTALLAKHEIVLTGERIRLGSAALTLSRRRDTRSIGQCTEARHQSRVLPDLYFLAGHQLFRASDRGRVVVECQLNAGDNCSSLFLEIVEAVLRHWTTPFSLIVPAPLIRVAPLCSLTPAIHIPNFGGLPGVYGSSLIRVG
jgi:hypothetical protein